MCTQSVHAVSIGTEGITLSSINELAQKVHISYETEKLNSLTKSTFKPGLNIIAMDRTIKN